PIDVTRWAILSCLPPGGFVYGRRHRGVGRPPQGAAVEPPAGHAAAGVAAAGAPALAGGPGPHPALGAATPAGPASRLVAVPVGGGRRGRRTPVVAVEVPPGHGPGGDGVGLGPPPRRGGRW